MGQYETPMQVFWATGAAMFVKKNLWKEVGGFDGFFFAHQEEIDLCWRLQNNGYKIYCCPQSVVYHVGGGTLPQKSSMKTFLNFRNNNIMLLKNLPLEEKIWKIPFRLLLDIVFAIKSLIFGDTASITAVGKAHFAVLKWVFMKKGKNSLKSKPTNKLIGIYKGSVVWDYFIKNKKRFPEIVNN